MDLEVLEWKRGKWEKTIYSMRRDDFCKAAFDPMEIWFPLSMQIPQEDRVCPPPLGVSRFCFRVIPKDFDLPLIFHYTENLVYIIYC